MIHTDDDAALLQLKLRYYNLRKFMETDVSLAHRAQVDATLKQLWADWSAYEEAR